MKGALRGSKLKRGDVVEIEWLDTHSSDKLSLDEIEELDDPGLTVAYGIVLRNGRDYLTIASEFCTDLSSDGNYLEQIPHGTIQGIKMLGRREIEPIKP